MSGKTLLFDTFRHKAHSQIPWIPFAGVHAGKLRGYNAVEVLTDGTKLYDALLYAHQQYQPDGQPILFDLQVEAEILGCELQWDAKAPPSVLIHPLATNQDIPDRLPEAGNGRLPMILDVMRKMKATVGDQTGLLGLVCGPFTLASHLRGTQIFLDMYDDVEFLDALLDFTTAVNKRMAHLYLEAGMDLIAVVDPLVSQISPQHFETFLSARFTSIFDELRQQEALSAFFVCGDATRNISVMAATHPDSIFVDENIDMVQAKEITDRYNIVLGGNIPLTSIMLYGSQEDNMKFVLDWMEAFADHQNLVLAPGCDMPYDIPEQNVIGILQAIRDPNRVRQILAHYQQPMILQDIVLPDYGHLSKPLVEVFTIDSATCPACTYMLRAAESAKAQLGARIDMIEYKMTSPENIARVRRLNIRSLPALAINGELRFASLIPDQRTLVATIEEYC
ncbi:MAG: uroporphyrinogen decarboxylase [Chloroflexi bacterium]|nr:uroporphyrinogen decarboxylase [Chloroflexota bacterium]